MQAKLVVAKGKTEVKEIPLTSEKTIIGRRNDCSLQIPSPLVSRQHCELVRAAKGLVVKDLGSSNGTFVNGTKVKQKQLKSGDTLGVGPVTFIVQLDGAPVSPSDTTRPSSGPTTQEADFVVAEEVVEEAASADADDFIVAEEATGGDDDFVVTEELADTEAIADLIVDENATEVDGDFVTAVAQADDNTVHDMHADDLAAAKAEAKSAEPAAEAESEESPKKKGGLFGRFFGRKAKADAPAADAPSPAEEKPAKKPEAAQAREPAAKGKEPAPAKTKEPAPAAKADSAPPAATPAPVDDDMPDFFVDDDSSGKPSKPVGDDELADFLMGLNEKDE